MDIDDGRVITNFIQNILDDKPVIINGDGKQTRSFCYIDDLLIGLINLMNCEYNQPVNLGNPYTEVNLLELKDIFSKILNKEIKCVYQPLMQNDPLIRKPDISLAQKLFNFNPTITLEEGLKKTINYFINKK
jgi:UDP-glucuronate decarboxylase